MSLAVTLMIEGQEDLTWERWQRLAEAAESGGFAGLFRSDHLAGLFGDPKRASLEPWASLTWLATATRTIRFGPLVSPLTFHHPALLAKRAAAIDLLSGGRFDLGIGAGWHEGEHRMFGIPFPSVKERLDRLDCGARAIRLLVRRRLDRVRAVFPRVPGDEAGWREAGFLYGSPDEIRRDLERWRELGITRVMLQMLDLDDLEAIGLIASEIVLVMR